MDNQQDCLSEGTAGPSRRSILVRSVVRRCTEFIVLNLALIAAPAVAAIGFVQINYATPQTAQTSVPVIFTGAQTAGNLNVVVVGWNDSTAVISSVTDSKGNVYAPAVGPTAVAGKLSQSVYYAKNIAAAAANANTVTVKFNVAAVAADIRILEYSGLDLASPVDVVSAASGTGTTASTPAVVTTNANDLLFGAATVTSHNTGPGAGFTSRVITSPDGDIAEDRIVTAVGSYSATAPMTSGSWVMQMVAFKAAGVVVDTMPPTAPSNLAATATSSTGINLTWTASTDNVGVAGYRVERCQGTGCATFAQIATPIGTSFADTGLVGSTSYSYQVRAADTTGNLSTYSNIATAQTQAPGPVIQPAFSTETHSATESSTAPSNSATLSVNVTGSNALLIAAWHAEYDGGLPNSWTVTRNGVPGTTIVETDGYTGGSGNRRFRIYYWLNPTPGPNTIVVSNPYTGPNELAVSVILLNNVDPTNPIGAPSLDVSAVARTGETETVTSATGDLIVHVIADALLVRGSLGDGETSVSVANDGLHPADGDASLWLSTKPGGGPSTTVSSSGWASRIINGVAFAVHGAPSSPLPDLTLAKTHSGTFAQGQIGATYTLAAANVGTATTTGVVTVVDTLPSGLTATALTGTGWSCSVATLSCTRSDALAAGASYPAITLTVNVSSAAPASVTNTATVSGGGESNTANDSAIDVTTITVVDTTAPTAPAGLAATTTGSATINLSWTASTDDVGVTGYRVERCQGAGCTTFAQIATPVATTFGDTGLTAGTSYSYRVRATDAAANLSAYSNTASATTTAVDTTPPTAPSALVATAAGNTSINVSWTAATDNVGVTGYRVERCQGAGCTTFAQIATPTATSFADSGLSAGTNYSYRVRATDAAANLGPYSNTASATTTSTAGTIAFKQVNYATPQSAQTSVPVAYTGAQTAGNLNVVVVGWNDSTAVVSSVTDSKGNVYVPAVGPTSVTGKLSQSIYYAKNIAAAAANANTVTVKFNVAAQFADIRVLEYSGLDTANPVDVIAAGSGTGTTASTPAVATTNANDLLFGAATVTSRNTGPGTGFTNRVITSPDADIAEDRIVTAVGSYSASAPMTSGSWVMQMVAFKAAGAVVDATPPTAPSNLAATATSGVTVTINWTSSTDNIGVTVYMVERCAGPSCTNFAQVGTTSSASYGDTGLAALSTYVYRVRAADAAGNLSGYSNVASATTLAPDTQPPTAPTGLTATAINASQINLSWTASTDDVGVTAYRVLRCQQTGTAADCPNFVKVIQQSAPATTYADATGLLPATTYRYIAQAVDAAGNISTSSNEAAATTLAAAGLVAAYSFDEGTGSTLTDLSGNANHGTIASAAWTTAGKFNGALVFNGTNAAVNVIDSPSLRLTSAMTLEAWVNPATVTSAWRDVIYKGNDNYYLMGTTTNSGIFAGGGTFGGANANAYGSTALPINTWSHIAVTYDGTALRVYLNATLVTTLARTGAITTSANPLQIGGDSIFGQFFQGAIDEVRIYNRALAQPEILTDMNTPLGTAFVPPSNLLASVVSGSQVNLTWTAAHSNLGIASYSVERCVGTGCTNFAPIGTTAVAAFSDMTVVPNATFRYRVQATDTGGSTTPYSNIADAFTGLVVTPRAAAITSTRTQQYTAIGGNTSSVVWAVDGIGGGSASAGTISTTGLYAPPAAAGMHTVTATSTDQSQSASATIYITNYAGKFTHHNDNLRTGANVTETVLTPTNVNAATFGKLFTYQLDGTMHASALYVANVNIPQLGLRNVVYASTEHDSVYAFDADGLSAAPLWQASFINPAAGVTSVPANDTGECCDIAGEIGITGTPVIDPASSTLYVVAKTKEVIGSTTNYVQRLHALDIATGAEKFGGPVVLQASVPGTGTGAQGGQLPFDPLHENQRPALLLNNGVVYIGFASHGDRPPFHGWVLGYNATTLQRVLAYCATANGTGGGIWLSGGGLNADSAGNVYFVTGNGTFDANTGGVDFGDSFVKLSPTGSVLDYFSPHDQASLNAANFDLGSSNLLLLPDQPGAHPHLALSAGKNENIHVVDRDNMGHFNANNDSQIVQSLVNIFPNGTPEPGNYNAPVYFNGTVYFGPVNDTLMAFKMSNGLLPAVPTSKSSEVYTYPGGAIAASGNGSINGILWGVQKNGTIAAGGLRAYDANNLAVELYNSDQAGTRDTLDIAAKFSVPLVANGKVYIGSMNNLTAYGLLP
jgi:chitodextrinase